jgi:hypothetical protein
LVEVEQHADAVALQAATDAECAAAEGAAENQEDQEDY